MTKAGEPLDQNISDSGFDGFLNRPFEGLGSVPSEFQNQTGYSYEELVEQMESIKAKDFTTTIAFTSTDYRTVTWAAGEISYRDGLVTPEIATSNTGNMASRTYIYYDPQKSKVALNVTTTATIATQGERLLLAIAVPNANTNSKAEVQVFGATGMYIANLSVEHLTAGSIRSKTITLAVTADAGDCFFNAGKDNFTNTDSGFILGIDDSDGDKAKFYIGDASNYLNWTGSALNIKGVITVEAGSNVEAGADVTSTHTSADTSAVNGLASSSVSGWAHGSDTTKIDGGDIYTNTVTAAQINVTNLQALAVNTGTLTVNEAINVGGARIKFDGANNRILISDASRGRLVFDNDGTFKISKAGEEVLTATGTELAFYFNPSTNSIEKGGCEINTMQEIQIPLLMSGASGGFRSYYTNQHANIQYLWPSRFQIDKDDYRSCSFLLEAVYRAGAGGAEPPRTFNMDLYDVAATAVVTNSPISGATQSGSDPAGYPLVRGTTNFRGYMTSGTRTYVLRYWKSDNVDSGIYIDLYEARLIIKIV